MNEIELFLGALLAGLSTVLFLTSLVAWKRTGSLKIGFVALALFVFMMKGMYVVFLALSEGKMPEDFTMLLLDFSAIALIYLSVLKG